jgi:hypothetical protein
MMSSSTNFLLFECKVFDVFQGIYKFHGVGVMNKDPINKKNSNSLILTNVRVGFEPCVLDFI